MIVGVLRAELAVMGAVTLKDKRRVIKSIKDRLANKHNVSIAEVDALDSHQRAVLGVACVSSSAGYAHGLLERVVQWIETNRPDVELLEYRIEFL